MAGAGLHVPVAGTCGSVAAAGPWATTTAGTRSTPRVEVGPAAGRTPRLMGFHAALEGEVLYAELGMDFEATSGWVLPASPEHALRVTVLPLQEQAAVLRQAVRALQPHPLVGRLLPAEKSPRCHSLMALGGRTCLGLKGRPYFAPRNEMVRMLQGFGAHYVTQWQRWLSGSLHAAPMADFLGGFSPLAPAGKAPLRPY